MRRSRIMVAGAAIAIAVLASACTKTAESPKASLAGSVAGEAAELSADVRILSSGVVQVGSADAGASIDLYEDFLCPACAHFITNYGADLVAKIEAGSLAVSFHDLNFLDRASASEDYSTRAAAAALCVAQEGDAATYLKFRDTLFLYQPMEHGSTDLSDAELADLAVRHGVSTTAATCVETGAKVELAAEQAELSTMDLSAKSGGQVSTPSVLDGTIRLDPSSQNWLDDLTG